MSLGEEEAAAVFKHLAPKEVQKLGETIARMKSITRERMDGVLDASAPRRNPSTCWCRTPTNT
jgi:flagellar motor switch protein FliG